MAGKTAAKTEKVAVLARSLKGMFRKLEARPVPENIRSAVDQLEAADTQPLKKSG